MYLKIKSNTRVNLLLNEMKCEGAVLQLIEPRKLDNVAYSEERQSLAKIDQVFGPLPLAALRKSHAKEV